MNQVPDLTVTQEYLNEMVNTTGGFQGIPGSNPDRGRFFGSVNDLQQLSYPQMMSAMYGHQQSSFPQYQNHRKMPQYHRGSRKRPQFNRQFNRCRPTARRQAHEEAIEAGDRNNAATENQIPFDARKALERFLGTELSNFEELRIDKDIVRENQRQLALTRLNARRAHVNMWSNRTTQIPHHFLNLPREIRYKIYENLFEGARVTFALQDVPGVGPFARGQSDVFRRENMSTEILFVCKDVHAEALRVLFANLAIVDGHLAPRDDFALCVSEGTANAGQEVWGVRPQVAVDGFRSLRLWVRTETYLINHQVWTQFTSLDSNDMFTNAVQLLDGDDIPSKDLLKSVRMADRPQHTAFVCKIDLLCCYHIGLRSDSALFRRSFLRPVCLDEHDSIGHIYLDFFKEVAIFDWMDEKGHDACITTLRRM